MDRILLPEVPYLHIRNITTWPTQGLYSRQHKEPQEILPSIFKPDLSYNLGRLRTIQTILRIMVHFQRARWLKPRVGSNMLREVASQSQVSKARAPLPVVPSRNNKSLSRVPLGNVLRSYLLTYAMSTPMLLWPPLALLGRITESKSRVLNPDMNPLMGWLLRHTIYNHFCSGETKTEVLSSADILRTSGVHGIILGHAREIVLKDPTGQDVEEKKEIYGQNCFRMVEEWKQSNMETLKLIGKDDFLSVKSENHDPPLYSASSN